MTSQYTTNLLNNILPSTTVNNNAQNSNGQNLSDTGFSEVLDNSLKSYTDKSEAKQTTKDNYKNPAYAEKTKNVKNAKQKESVKTEPKTEKVTSKENNIKTEKDQTKDNSEITTQVEKNNTKESTKNKTTENQKIATEQNGIKEKIATEDENKETEAEVVINEVAINAVNESIIAQLEYTSQTENNVQVNNNEQQVSIDEQKISNDKEVIKTSQNVQISNVVKSVLNEIRTPEIETNTITTASTIMFDKSDINPISDLDLQNITKDLNSTLTTDISKSIDITKTDIQPVIQNETVQLSENIDLKNITNNETLQTTNLPETDLQDIEVDSSALNTKKPDLKPEINSQTTVKSTQMETKITFNSDNSKILLNLEEEPVVDNQPQVVNQKPITQIDTELDKEPMIKVAEDVISTVNEQVSTSFVENKDFSAQAKDKAVSQMTAIEKTNTVVKKVEHNTNSETQNNNPQNESSLQNQNAGEQLIKMNVENVSQPITNNEAFVNKFETTLNNVNFNNQAVKTETNINSADILNQINTKLDELQNNGNSKVSIVLKPENLGRVSVEIMNSQDGIIAKMTTDNQQVKELFDKNIESLKLSLGSQGVNVNNIKVECTQESSNHAMDFEREQFNQNNTSYQQEQNNKQNKYNTDSIANSSYADDSDVEFNESQELKNTETIIQHNGKVDYKV